MRNRRLDFHCTKCQRKALVNEMLKTLRKQQRAHEKSINVDLRDTFSQRTAWFKNGPNNHLCRVFVMFARNGSVAPALHDTKNLNFLKRAKRWKIQLLVLASLVHRAGPKLPTLLKSAAKDQKFET